MIDDIGLYLARFLCGSTLLFLSVWILERANIVKHLQLRAWLWKLAIVGSLILLIPTAALVSMPYRLPITVPAPEQPIGEQINSAPIGDEMGQVDAVAAEYATTIAALTEANISNDVGKPRMETPEPKTTAGVSLFSNPMRLVRAIWVLLSGFALLRLLFSYRRGIQSLGQRQLVDTNTQLYCLFRDLCVEAGINNPPTLSKAPRTATPVTLLTNEVCLPHWIDEHLHDAEIKSLLAHEIGHVKNKDLYWLLTTQILCCLFFFQPLFHVARNRLVDISEFLADQWAVIQCRNTNDIANALLTCATEVRHRHTLQWGLAMTGKPSRLRSRIEAILCSGGNAITSVSPWRRVSVMVVFLTCAVLVPKFEYSYAATDNEQDQTSAADKIEALQQTETKVELELKRQQLEQELKAVAARREVQQERLQMMKQKQRKAASQLEVKREMLAKEQEQLQQQIEAVNDLQKELIDERRKLDFSHDNISSSISIQSTSGRSHAKWTDNGTMEEIYWRGDIGINDEETAITSLDRGGYFEYSSSGFGPNRNITLSNKDGDIVVIYKVDGETTKFTEADQEWFHEVLVRFFRRSGVGAEERVERLLRRGGVDAVLEELAYINSDRAHRIYTTILIEKETLTDDQFMQVMQATNTISSDSEMRRLMSAIIENGKVTGKRWDYILPATLTISSDSEMRRLLENIAAQKVSFSGDQWRFFLAAAGTISSDSELSELLVDLMNSATLSDNAWKQILELIDKSISSNSEKGKALRQAAKSLPNNNDSLRDLYNNAVKNVSSRSTRESLSVL